MMIILKNYIYSAFYGVNNVIPKLGERNIHTIQVNVIDD